MKASHTQMDKMKTSVCHRGVVWGGLYAVVLTAFVASVTWGFAEQEPAEVGLRGLIAYEVPEDLSEEAWLEQLAGTWEQWSKKTAAVVQKLYEGEGLDVAGQREVIATLKDKLDVMRKEVTKPWSEGSLQKHQSIFDGLVTMHGRLSRRVAVAEALLDTLELDPATVQAARVVRIESASKDVAKAVDALKTYLDSIKSGAAWLPYVRADELVKQTEAGKSPQAAIPLLEGVQKKFKAKGTLPDEQRKFVSRPKFAALEAAINAYLKLAKQKPKTVNIAKLRGQITPLVEALEEYEATNSRVAATAIHKALGAIRALSLDDGERIDAALGPHYFNFNLRVVASEGLVNRLIGEERKEEGEVSDYILGADVSGDQTTTATVGVDLKESEDGALFDVTLTGVVQSNTRGVTDKATVYTQGTHYFWATKAVSFNGEIFATQPAEISVNANNNTYDATTGLSHVPLFGALADRYAVGVAQGKRGQSEAIAASRVEDKALPKFNKEVDDEFKKINDELENDLRKRLRAKNLLPAANEAASTDTHLTLNSQVVAKGELGGSAPGSTPAIADAPLLVHVHESLLNNAADQIGLAGKTLTDKQVVVEMEKFLSDLLGREIKLDKEEGKEKAKPDAKKDEGPDTFVFDKNDPVRFHAEEGNLSLVIRAGFKQQGKEDIPTQEVTVPLKFSIQGDKVIVERDKIKVKPVKRPESIATQIARAGAIIKKLESALPKREVDGNVNLEQEGKTDFVMTVTEIKAVNGWLTVAFK